MSRHCWAVVLAGGDGTRLQNLILTIAGDARPKQFCPLLGEESLLAQTRARLESLFVSIDRCSPSRRHTKIDGRVAVHLKHNALLDVLAEAVLGDFELVGTDGKIGQRPNTIGAARRNAQNTGSGLSGLHPGAGKGSVGNIPDSANHLRGLSHYRGGDTANKNNNSACVLTLPILTPGHLTFLLTNLTNIC